MGVTGARLPWETLEKNWEGERWHPIVRSRPERVAARTAGRVSWVVLEGLPPLSCGLSLFLLPHFLFDNAKQSPF